MIAAIGYGLGLDMGKGKSYPKPTNHQLITTFTGTPNTTAVAMGAFARNPLRNQHKVGRVGGRDPKIIDFNYRILGGSGTEQGPPFAYSIRRALEVNGVTTVGLYSGVDGKAVQLTDVHVTTDLFSGLRLEANSQPFTRGERTVSTSTDTLIGIERVSPNSQGFRTNTASQLASTGAFNNSGGSGQPACWPGLIAAIPDRPCASVMLFGDSIFNGRDAPNTPEEGGYGAYAMNNMSGGAVPWTRHTVEANSMSASQNSFRFRDALPYLTDFMCNLGRNDVTGASLATLQARLIAIVDPIRLIMGPYGRRIRIHWMTTLPSTAFDSSQNAVVASWNAWLMAGADGRVDKCYNVAAVAGDPATWGTDGTHPPSSVHLACAQVVMSEFRPYLNPYFGNAA